MHKHTHTETYNLLYYKILEIETYRSPFYIKYFKIKNDSWVESNLKSSLGEWRRVGYVKHREILGQEKYSL